MILDLLIPENAYFVGFVLGDGHLSEDTRNRGKLRIELSKRDGDIIRRFNCLFADVYSCIGARTRNTNFKADHTSASLTIYDWSFREALIAVGVPVGSKSHIVSVPSVPFSVPDLYRGLIDADGSLGITSASTPFLSLNTSSDDMAMAYQRFLAGIIGYEKRNNRNKRDGSYNIVVTREDAQKVCALLYYPECMALSRKLEKATEVMGWVRPLNMRYRPPRTPWTHEQDTYILAHSVDESMAVLGRGLSSIKNRLNRLRG